MYLILENNLLAAEEMQTMLRQLVQHELHWHGRSERIDLLKFITNLSPVHLSFYVKRFAVNLDQKGDIRSAWDLAAFAEFDGGVILAHWRQHSGLTLHRILEQYSVKSQEAPRAIRELFAIGTRDILGEGVTI